MYYIASGEKNKMYTLRQSVSKGLFQDDFYVCNLSTDWETAMQKAAEFAGDNLNLEASFTLDEIERRTSEQKQRDEAALQAERDAEKAERENRRMERMRACLARREWPFGKHEGRAIEGTDAGYIRFFYNLEAEADRKGDVLRTLQQILESVFPELKTALPVANGEHYGELKSRETMTATLIEAFSFDGYFGVTNVLRFVKDSGELLVYMGSALIIDADNVSPEIGKTYTFKATVKSHENYKNEQQTKVARIAKWAAAA